MWATRIRPGSPEPTVALRLPRLSSSKDTHEGAALRMAARIWPSWPATPPTKDRLRTRAAASSTWSALTDSGPNNGAASTTSPAAIALLRAEHSSGVSGSSPLQRTRHHTPGPPAWYPNGLSDHSVGSRKEVHALDSKRSRRLVAVRPGPNSAASRTCPCPHPGGARDSRQLRRQLALCTPRGGRAGESVLGSVRPERRGPGHARGSAGEARPPRLPSGRRPSPDARRILDPLPLLRDLSQFLRLPGWDGRGDAPARQDWLRTRRADREPVDG